MSRTRLPARRASFVFQFQHDGVHYITMYSPADGRGGGPPAEIFLNAGKLDSGVDTMARDCAIAASLAFQHGCGVDELRSALTRTAGGGPAGPLAIALDLIAAQQAETTVSPPVTEPTVDPGFSPAGVEDAR